MECRICLLPESVSSRGEGLYSVCSCLGTAERVHFHCLAAWVREKGDLNCEICGQPYREPFLERLQKEVIPSRQTNVSMSQDNVAPVGPRAHSPTTRPLTTLCQRNAKRLRLALEILMLGMGLGQLENSSLL